MVQVRIFQEFLKRPYKFRKLGFFLALTNESHEPKKVRKPFFFRERKTFNIFQIQNNLHCFAGFLAGNT
jgi:hypothetical protein